MSLSEILKSRFSMPLMAIPVAFALSVSVHAASLKQVLPLQANPDSVYQIAEKMPSFPGGDRALMNYIRKKAKYPSKARKSNEHGRVVVQFVVGKTGKVEKPEVMKGVSEVLDQEALRVVGSMPRWMPGEQGSAKVAVQMVLPVTFRNDADPDQWEANENTVVVVDGVVMPEGFDMNILNATKFSSVKILRPFPKDEVKALKKKFGKRAADGVIVIATNRDEMYYDLADTLQALDPAIAGCKEAEVLPQFPGGKEKMFQYIADSIQYPFVARQTKTQGKVMVRFKVDKTGKISEAAVAQSLNYFLDKEALRVINTMPQWAPAAKCGHPLEVFVTMPVVFKLNLSPQEKAWERTEKTVVLLNGKRLPGSFDLKLMSYANLKNYQVLQPTSKEVIKKLVSKYGKDAVNGVILIETER